MATTARVRLTQEQREQLAKDLRMETAAVPEELAVVAVSPEASDHLGMPKEMHYKFSPAMLIT